MKTIPASVLNLLNVEWKSKGDFSEFDSVFTADRDHRKRQPSYYIIRKGKEIEYETDILSYQEALGLTQESVFASLALPKENSVVINEHAQHALTDFCAEVYDSWRKYIKRVAEINAVGVYPSNQEG